jgi:hypothetical protein
MLLTNAMRTWTQAGPNCLYLPRKSDAKSAIAVTIDWSAFLKAAVYTQHRALFAAMWRRNPAMARRFSRTLQRGGGMTAWTYTGLAEVSFEPIAGLDGANHETNLQRVTEVTRLAIGLLGKSKPELIEMVDAMSKEPGGMVSSMLKGIGDGKEKLEAMLEFVTAARLRVSSAAATVYPETPTGPAVDEAGSPR